MIKEKVKTSCKRLISIEIKHDDISSWWSSCTYTGLTYKYIIVKQNYIINYALESLTFAYTYHFESK